VQRWRRCTYKLGVLQNYKTFTLILLIKIVLCSEFPPTWFINYECFDMRLHRCAALENGYAKRASAEDGAAKLLWIQGREPRLQAKREPWTFTRKPRPDSGLESGLDCRVCAVLARQRVEPQNLFTCPGTFLGHPRCPSAASRV